MSDWKVVDDTHFTCDGYEYELVESVRNEPEEGKEGPSYLSYNIMCGAHRIGTASMWDFNDHATAKSESCLGSAQGKTHIEAAVALVELLRHCGGRWN